MRFVAKSPLKDEVQISPSRNLEQEEVADKWNNWVFELRASPGYDAEDTRSELELRNSVSAVKITNEWKLELDYHQNYRRTKYTYDDTLYDVFRSSHRLDNLIVKSLGEHWSIGARTDIRSSTFSNTHFSIDVLPSIEYNIFPYSQSTRRQMRILYSVGNSYRIYNDTTIYNNIRENLYQQQLRMAFEVQEKWGSVHISLDASNFLHDFSKNKVVLSGFLEVRIIKGLSLRLYGGIARIRDQLSLPGEELSEADILLQLQELQTGFQVMSSLSITYTFGSIYNNIVNPRFGNGGRWDYD
jgi:hypothetical protein